MFLPDQRVHVEGTFDHASENLLGPRTLLREAFDGNAGDPGMHVITPFTRADNGQRILVNRGFVPDSHRDAEASAPAHAAPSNPRALAPSRPRTRLPCCNALQQTSLYRIPT